MRTLAAALAILVPLPSVAGYVIHPAPGDPNSPAVVASQGQFVLDRFGLAWNSGGWSREPQFDPPIPLSDVLFWEPNHCVATSGEVFIGDGSGWLSVGLPPSVSGLTDFVALEIARTVPNPSSDSSRITFTLPIASHVSVRIFDATGRLVRTVLEGELPAGEAAVEWDGRSDTGESLPAGVYFSRVESSRREFGARLVRD